MLASDAVGSFPGGSYTRKRLGVTDRARELYTLLADQRADVPGRVDKVVGQLGEAEAAFESLLGEPMSGKSVLVIGPGQHLAEMTYFSRRNSVVGIDLDVVPQRLAPLEYWRMVKVNGGIRALKTIGRKAVGIDRAFQAEVARRLGIERVPLHDLMAMDAAAMTFGEGSFDCVYSHSCFEHIEDPATVMSQVRRVLRPGGAALVEVHLYTSDSGCHDVRIFAGRRQDLPAWSHLRPEFRDRVRPNTYVNEISLSEWERMFTDAWPGVELTHRHDEDPYLLRELEDLRRRGELSGYLDEELLTSTLAAEWCKPKL